MTTWCWAARSWAANLNRNLLANHSWHATGHSVRLAYLAALLDLNGLGVALTSAFGFANRTGTAFWNHFAHTVGAGFGFALGNHFAGCVVTNLASVLANHSANLVTNFLGSALRNHLACCVVANFGSILANHTANFVTNFFGFALRNHSADCVVASFCAALRYHFANAVGAGFGPALRHNTANRIRHLASSAFASIPSAADLFLLASWYPHFLANGFWRTLHAFGTAFSRCVNTLACARIVSPSTGLTNGLFHYRAGDRLGLRFPMPTLNSHGPCVLFWDTNTVLFCSHLLLANSVVNGVVYLSCFGFVDWLAYGVINRS